jgi:ribose 5-phosphate isomerase
VKKKSNRKVAVCVEGRCSVGAGTGKTSKEHECVNRLQRQSLMAFVSSSVLDLCALSHMYEVLISVPYRLFFVCRLLWS